MKFPLIHFLLLYLILFSEKDVFYSKNIQYAYNFYGTDLNVCRDVFRTQLDIYGGTFLRKSKKSFIVDALLGSEYVSSIGFAVEKVYRSHHLSDIVKFDFKNLSLRSCFFNWRNTFWVNEEVVTCSQVFCCCWQVKYIQTWIKTQ